MPDTILRLRSRTPDISIVKQLCVIPNSLLWRKYDATLALWMMFLLGRHTMFGHDLPIYLRSMTATRFPSPANVHAAIVDPVPPPRMTRSYSPGHSSPAAEMKEILLNREGTALRAGHHRLDL